MTKQGMAEDYKCMSISTCLYLTILVEGIPLVLLRITDRLVFNIRSLITRICLRQLKLTNQLHRAQSFLSSASQELPHILWNTEIHYRIHKGPPPLCILSQMNPIYSPTSLLEIPFQYYSHIYD